MVNGKLLITMLAILLLVAGSALAVKPVNPGNSVGSIDDECQANGFDFGIVKFEWNDTAFEAETAPISPYNVDVTGTNNGVNWSATPKVAGVINKQGQDVIVLPGGNEGSAHKVDHGISHLTFCGDDEEVPEFGTITAIAVLGLAGAFIFSKRK